MADKFVVLEAGFVSRVGRPLELYHYPENRFVAGFIGSPKMNFMSVFIEAAEKDRVMVQLANGTAFWIPVDGTTVTRGERMSLGIRPEHLLPANEGDATIEGEVNIVEKLGNETQAYLQIDAADAGMLYRQHEPLDLCISKHTLT